MGWCDHGHPFRRLYSAPAAGPQAGVADVRRVSYFTFRRRGPTLIDHSSLREDKQYLHVPRTFEQLKDLNTLLKKYRSLYPFRIVLCFVITYLL